MSIPIGYGIESYCDGRSTLPPTCTPLYLREPVDPTRYVLVIARFFLTYLEPPFAQVRACIGSTVHEQR
jgi:hypothetical protein